MNVGPRSGLKLRSDFFTSFGMEILKALSIRQPWAWLIVNGFKDIENRSWNTSFRGAFLVHASKSMTRRDYQEAALVAGTNRVEIPDFGELPRGGIVGVAEISDCVSYADSPWFFGRWGFVIKNARPLEFERCGGRLNFFIPQISNQLELL